MSNEIKGVPVFKAGTFIPGNTGIPQKYTTDDLWEMVRNFSELNRRAPIKVGHSAKQVLAGQSDGDPALGRVTNLRVDGDRLIADLVDIPDVLYTAIKAGLWSEISAELEFIDTRGWTLNAIAILGANLPAVSNLGELQAYLNAHPPVGIPDAGAVLCLSVATPTSIRGAAMAENKDNKDNTDARIAAIEERERAFEFKSALGVARLDCDKQVIAGTMTPAIRDKIIKHYELAGPTFKVGDKLNVPAEMVPEIIALAATLPRGEQAKGAEFSKADPGSAIAEDDQPDSVIARKAQLLMSQRPGLSYDAAARQVLLSEPALKTQYFAQTTSEIRELLSGRV